ncbi:pterin-4-alpha-carbinolamine dehydratase [Candidatus Tenderia electrophaga]|jgi:4a-hydroxytetrahydrobiopterin dehydratase|uniref:Putative pterin-4-alpha-carbinolamine dehydratase n=1 Tax=Candidatus Tenderia electrophaga TaxID=1748243 RepID=A0A0S2TH15_9GAMM|nr:pterin-4-alpha-carbinolamine dehydratase [Candidatus Tenderia electrophaga]
MATKASDNDIQAFLSELSDWRVEDGKLHREYQFKNFVEAFGFMTQAALAAEKADHHPEWFNVYKKVVVDLTTHEADGISAKDFDLARQMEAAAKC